MITNFINLLTFIRIIFAVIISGLLILGDYYLYALILFIFAGISDFLDGYLARKYNASSDIGEILDPIADKILVVFVLITLSVNLSSFLIAFLSSLIISREIWVSALRDFSSRNAILSATKVTYLAKIKTAIQLGTISLYLLGLAIDKMIFIVIGDISLILSALITIYTGYVYTINVFNKNDLVKF
tara:strand:+ start:900 stop:1457 length:558 start_codon:yes stop_codon:yes gene_type:complete